MKDIHGRDLKRGDVVLFGRGGINTGLSPAIVLGVKTYYGETYLQLKTVNLIKWGVNAHKQLTFGYPIRRSPDCNSPTGQTANVFLYDGDIQSLFPKFDISEKDGIPFFTLKQS